MTNITALAGTRATRNLAQSHSQFRAWFPTAATTLSQFPPPPDTTFLRVKKDDTQRRFGARPPAEIDWRVFSKLQSLTISPRPTPTMCVWSLGPMAFDAMTQASPTFLDALEHLPVLKEVRITSPSSQLRDFWPVWSKLADGPRCGLDTPP